MASRRHSNRVCPGSEGSARWTKCYDVLRPALYLALMGLTFSAVNQTQGGSAEAVPPGGLAQRPFGKDDAAGFREPSKVYHPETWFHFIGGNVAKPGITADLEAIAGAGISGVQLFHGQFGGAWPGVEPQIKCLSGSWDGAVQHAAAECRRLGLRFTMQNCPGWAMAGGPWITPDKAMRHLSWSRTDVTGGSNLSVVLPRPQPSQEEWRDYREVAVVAFPTPEGDTGKALVPASVKSNRESLPWAKCLRGEKEGNLVLEPGNEPVWVEASFQEEVTLRTVEFPSVQSFSHPWCYVPEVTVTVQAVRPDGVREVARHEMPQSNWQGNKPISLSCSEAPAKTYRIIIDHKHPMALAYIRLFTGARHNNWEAEGAWVLGGLDRAAHPRQAQAAWIDPARIVDLTGRMDGKGVLRWDAPPGRWTVLRWGHVNSGKRNGPAPAEATGWECDKLSTQGAEAHFAGYIGRLAAGDGAVGGGLLQGLLLDSWECETQTWTPGMDGEFSKLRGYRLLPWLPALAGYVIDHPETTARFLRDWRATVNDLMVVNFFGRMAALGHQSGLAVSFETASGDVFPGDILEYFKHADVPMCEFWQPRSEAFVGSFEFKPVKPCVSAARVYGKPRVAAEAFTSFDLTWNEHPGMLKHIADMHLAEGVTHLVFHTYTHNPRADFLPPGTAFGSSIGTPFLRGQTWWKHMPEFTAYLARCGYLLERGRPVSDVLWYLGDEQDHKPRQDAPFPHGYRYDYCNPDVLLHRLSVRDGNIVTPEGLRYRLLWLRDCPRMLPETLERMLSLVKQGAVLVGERPKGLATLSGGASAERRFHRAVEALWGKDGLSGVRRLGRGKVISGMSLDDALAKLGIGPDVQGEGVVWTHRQADGADWYFVAAPARQGFRGTLRFRALGAVEFWDPLSGDAKPAGVARRDGATSLVALDLPPSGSVFVVFRPANQVAGSRVVRLERNGSAVAEAQAPQRTVDSFQVVSASYGDPANPARRKDVRELVRRDVAHGASAIRSGNAWAGGDPAPQTRKRLLVVVRSLDGQEKRLEAWEGEPLDLVDPSAVPGPACEVLEGGKRLLAWEPGAFRTLDENGNLKTWEARNPRSRALEAPWLLGFPAGWGAPDSVRVDKLMSWTELGLSPEGRAFSGTAVYTTDFAMDAVATGSRVELDLGRVEVIASVRVNGQPAGSLWLAPYRMDITRFVKPGVNHLTVEVTSTWFNRLVYDAGLEEKARKTWTISGPGKERALVPSGLLGPVKLRFGEVIDAGKP